MHVKKSDLARLQTESKASASPLVEESAVKELSNQKAGPSSFGKSKKWQLDLSKIISQTASKDKQYLQTEIQVNSAGTDPEDTKLNEDIDDDDEEDVQ